MATRKHEFEIEIDASTEDVWRAISEGEQIQQWFAPEAKIENGKLFLSWGPGMEGSAALTTFEPGKRIGWIEGPDSEYPKVVEFSIEAAGGKTKLRLVHSGFGEGASFDSEYESTHGGWLTFLAALRYLAERKGSKKGRHVWRFFMIDAPRLDVWARMTDALGLSTQDWTPGAPYNATVPGGGDFSGIVVAAPKPGYALLRVDQLDGSLLALFAEGSGQCMCTTSWYLYGSAAEGQQPLVDSWLEYLNQLQAAPAQP